MVDMAKYHHDTGNDFIRRSLNQMSRELFLAQSSDWAFLVTTGTAIDYAMQRTKEHIHNFLRLRDMVESVNEDYGMLEKLEYKNSIFPDMDFRIYC